MNFNSVIERIADSKEVVIKEPIFFKAAHSTDPIL
jgi:hypothetical protein